VPTPEELERAKTTGVVPIALVLTRKRCGKFKCRAVVLGNLYKPGGELEVYAPVISFGASRYLLIDAAAHGDAIILFDIDNAFVQSLIDSEIFIRLPKEWREQNDDGNRKLVRALYGLPQSPRLWAKHYEKKLVSLGWTQSTEKGLWRKLSKATGNNFQSYKKFSKYMKMGVYVDDNTATGPDEHELRHEVSLILKEFPGKIIEPEHQPNGDLLYDQLGAEVH
ncbi:unnamed protein product, partial [Amoebophrya sp. A120]